MIEGYLGRRTECTFFIKEGRANFSMPDGYAQVLRDAAKMPEEQAMKFLREHGFVVWQGK